MGFEGLSPVIDLVFCKTYIKNFLLFVFEFQNMAITLLMAIDEAFLENVLMMTKHRPN